MGPKREFCQIRLVDFFFKYIKEINKMSQLDKYKVVFTVKSLGFEEEIRDMAISGSRPRSMTLKMT